MIVVGRFEREGYAESPQPAATDRRVETSLENVRLKFGNSYSTGGGDS